MKKNFTQPSVKQLVKALARVVLPAVLLLTGTALHAQGTNRFNDGYLTVFKVTSSAALTNTGTAIVVEEYLPATAAQSAPNYSFSVPSGTSGVVVSGSAGSAGAMTRSENGRYLVLPGYAAAVGAANTTFNTNGTARILNGSGTMSAGVTGSFYTTNNDFRGAVTDDGTNFWFSGGSLGTRYTNNGTTVTTIQSGTTTSYTNTRVINIFNGQLYYATGSGTPSTGIYKVGSGKPVTTGQDATILAAPSAPYGFSISPDGLTIYTVNSTSTVVRYTYSGTYNPATFTYSGGSWSAASTGFSISGATGLAVDWNGYSFTTGANGAVIYACNPTTLVRGTDNGTGAITTTTLRTISGNNAFRGLAFSPVKQTVFKGTNAPAAANLSAAAANAVLFGFSITADEGYSTIKKIILSQGGTATLGSGNDISNFRLIEDANNNGVAESSEIAASLATGSVSGSTISFNNITAAYMNEGTQKNFLVIGDVSSTATSGATFIPSIASNRTINGVNYTSNVGNAGGSLVTIGTNAPTGATLTILSRTITVSGTLAALTTVQGTASSTTTFTVSGQNLTQGISVTPPAGFEVSTTADFSANVGNATTPLVVGGAGNVATTTVYVRLAASAAAGQYSGDISVSTAGVTTATIATVQSTVTSPHLDDQTISFPAIANATYGDAPFALGATASSGLTVTYTSSDTSIATVSGNTVTLTGVGEVTIYANQAGNNAYNAAPQVSSTFTVSPKIIQATGAIVQTRPYDGTINCTIDISGGVTLDGVVSTDVVSVVSVTGTYIYGPDAGVNKYVEAFYTLTGADAAKYIVAHALYGTVTKADQAITFANIPSKALTDPDFDAGATSATSSVNPITYTSSNTAVATVTGSTIHIVGLGTTTITAAQAESDNYNPVSVGRTLRVTDGSFSEGNLVVVKVGTGSGTLGNSSVPVSLSEFTTTGDATVSIDVPSATAGSRLVMSGSATSEGQLNLSADGQYLTIAGYDAAVGTASVASSSASTANRVVGRISANRQFQITSLGSSAHGGNNIRGAATNDGSRFWTVGGTGGIFTVQPGAGAASLVASTPANVRAISIFNGQLYVGSASGTPAIYTVGTGLPTGTATSSTFLATGSIDPYASVIVKRADNQFNLYVASGTSGGGIYKWSSANGTTWTAQGKVAVAGVSFYGVTARKTDDGNVEVYATSPANIYKMVDTTAYDATLTGSSITLTSIATAATNTAFRGIAFAPALKVPAITNTTLTLSGDLNVALANYTITADNAPQSYNATGLPAGVTINTQTGVISGTPLNAGTFNVTISATNAAGTDSRTLVITIAKGNQLITFNALDPKEVTDADFELNATSATSSINPITYTSSNPAVATVTGNVVHITGVGSTTITASQAGNSDYNAAPSVAQTQVVTSPALTAQTINFDAIPTQTYGVGTFNLGATTSSGLTVSYTSSDTSIATISGNVVTVLSTGTVNITASQSGDSTYNAAVDVVQPLTIAPKPLTVTDALVTTKAYDGTTTATVTGGTLNGVVGTDVVSLVNGGGTFADANAATNIAVTTAFTLTGAQAYRYTVVQPAVTGTITKANQAITFAAFPVKSTLEPVITLTSFSTTSQVNPVTYFSSNDAVAVVGQSTTNGVTTWTLNVVGTGTATITAAQAESQNYNGTTAQQVITVQPGVYLNQFTGASACPTNGNVAFTATNATGSAVLRNGSMTCQSTGNVFNSTTLNTGTAPSETSYIEFSVSAAAGSKLNLTSLSFFRQASNSAPNQLELRYSTDGFATTNYTAYTAPASPTVGTYLTWDFADFTSTVGGTVTFRLYPYGATRADLAGASATSGTFRIDDVTVFGTASKCFEWTGTTSNDWSTATNWCGGVVPAATDDVTIAVTANNPVISTGVAYAHNLTLGADATLTVNEGATLTVDNVLNVNATATLTVKDTAALVQGTATVTNANSGNIVFNKKGSSLYKNDYTMWSSPVTGQGLQAFSPETVTTRFYTYKSLGDVYSRVTDIATPFQPAKGYLIRMPNTSTVSGYDAGTTAIQFNGVFTGQPNNGTVTIPVSTEGNGYNAVGNPYPSPVNIYDFLLANAQVIDASSGLYFWRKRNNSASSSYATLTLAAFVANPAEGGGSNNDAFFTGSSSDWLLAPGQGFIVKASTTQPSPVVTFTNSMRRVQPSAGTAFFRHGADTASRLWLNITAQDGTASQTAVAYMQGATNGIDFGFDGRKFTDNNNINLYSVAANTALAVQARPQFTPTDVVALGYTAATAGTYTIAIGRKDGVFNQGQTVYLKDNTEGITRELTENSYTFTTEAGTFENRFEVVYTTEALGTDNPVATAANVVVYNNKGVIGIDAGTLQIQTVNIFDINGRKLFTRSAVNNNSTQITNLVAEQQVLIVEIVTNNGTVNKRVVY